MAGPMENCRIVGQGFYELALLIEIVSPLAQLYRVTTTVNGPQRNSMWSLICFKTIMPLYLRIYESWDIPWIRTVDILLSRADLTKKV